MVAASDVRPSDQDLHQRLASHAQWLDSDGTQGSRIDLSDENLSRCDLTEARLKRARCNQNTLFRDAMLRGADFSECEGLNSANLAGADLTGAKLPAVIEKFEMLKTVKDASTQTKTLFVSILAACAYSWLTIGATTDFQLLSDSSTFPLPVISTPLPTGAFYIVAPCILVLLFAYFQISMQRIWDLLGDLPAVFPDGVPLDKRTYPWLLSGIVRSRLRLLKEAPPPGAAVQTVVSFMLAYWVVPITLVGFWVRYLPRHDWPVTLLHVALILGTITLAVEFSRLAKGTLTREPVMRPLLLWLAPPATLLVGGVFGLKGTAAFAALCLCVAGGVGDLFIRWHLNAPRNEVFARTMWPAVRMQSLCSALLIGVFTTLSWGSILGERGTGERLLPWRERLDARYWTPKFWKQCRYDIFANLREIDPGSARGTTEGAKAPPASFRGRNIADGDLTRAHLAGADFRGADLRNAVLRNADLHDVDFEGADLREADFEYADLAAANVTGAKLAGAKLEFVAGLIPAQLHSGVSWQLACILPGDLSMRPQDCTTKRVLDLHGSILEGADLSGFDLRGADLRDASLFGTDLKGANLAGARVFRTDFRKTGITIAQIKRMQNGQLGIYDQSTIGLRVDRTDNFDNLDLTGVDLTGEDLAGISFKEAVLAKAFLGFNTILSWADFHNAKLAGAFMKGAVFYYTNFRGAKHFEALDPQTKRCAAQLSYTDDEQHNRRLKAGDLQGVDLSGCNISGAVFGRQDFDKGVEGTLDLTNADLTGAGMRTVTGRVVLKGAKLKDADLFEADLSEAKGLNKIQVVQALNWQLARLPPDLVRDLFHQPEHNYKIEHTDFGGLHPDNLVSANLRHAKFASADLSGVSLLGANLEWADFRGVKGLTASEITSAQNYVSAYFDDEFLPELGLAPDHNQSLKKAWDRLPVFLK
jgi:uncharacterized protein YjbI with pentapeptide repeats